MLCLCSPTGYLEGKILIKCVIMPVALEAGFTQGAEVVLPEFHALQDLPGGVPMCQEYCITRVQGFHTPELSAGVCSSYPQGAGVQAGAGPGCCTSPGIGLAPIGDGP